MHLPPLGGALSLGNLWAGQCRQSGAEAWRLLGAKSWQVRPGGLRGQDAHKAMVGGVLYGVGSVFWHGVSCVSWHHRSPVGPLESREGGTPFSSPAPLDPLGSWRWWGISHCSEAPRSVSFLPSSPLPPREQKACP